MLSNIPVGIFIEEPGNELRFSLLKSEMLLNLQERVFPF
jgi:hypothetical protein